jgi:hypothetical protein
LFFAFEKRGAVRKSGFDSFGTITQFRKFKITEYGILNCRTLGIYCPQRNKEYVRTISRRISFSVSVAAKGTDTDYFADPLSSAKAEKRQLPLQTDAAGYADWPCVTTIHQLMQLNQLMMQLIERHNNMRFLVAQLHRESDAQPSCFFCFAQLDVPVFPGVELHEAQRAAEMFCLPLLSSRSRACGNYRNLI